MPICKRCGISFEKWRPGGTYKYCPDCGYLNAKKKGFHARYQGPVLFRLKSIADASGNLKTWHAGDPLEGLPLSLQERIKRGLDFGI